MVGHGDEIEGAAELGAPDLAVPFGIRLLELRPDETRAAILTARMATAAGSHADAIALLDAAIEHAPASLDLLLVRLAILGAWPEPPDPVSHRERFDAEYDRLLPRVAGRPVEAVRRLRIGGAFFVVSEDWAIVRAVG